MVGRTRRGRHGGTALVPALLHDFLRELSTIAAFSEEWYDKFEDFVAQVPFRPSRQLEVKPTDPLLTKRRAVSGGDQGDVALRATARQPALAAVAVPHTAAVVVPRTAAAKSRPVPGLAEAEAASSHIPSAPATSTALPTQAAQQPATQPPTAQTPTAQPPTAQPPTPTAQPPTAVADQSPLPAVGACTAPVANANTDSQLRAGTSAVVGCPATCLQCNRLLPTVTLCCHCTPGGTVSTEHATKQWPHDLSDPPVFRFKAECLQRIQYLEQQQMGVDELRTLLATVQTELNRVRRRSEVLQQQCTSLGERQVAQLNHVQGCLRAEQQHLDEQKHGPPHSCPGSKRKFQCANDQLSSKSARSDDPLLGEDQEQQLQPGCATADAPTSRSWLQSVVEGHSSPRQAVGLSGGRSDVSQSDLVVEPADDMETEDGSSPRRRTSNRSRRLSMAAIESIYNAMEDQEFRGKRFA
eukprot:m.145968 g.145968  ORF g.145968 m.145968 type:complete len:468 (-) comp17236_c0_seq2:1950-3353(-)